MANYGIAVLSLVARWKEYKILDNLFLIIVQRDIYVWIAESVVLLVLLYYCWCCCIIVGVVLLLVLLYYCWYCCIIVGIVVLLLVLYYYWYCLIIGIVLLLVLLYYYWCCIIIGIVLFLVLHLLVFGDHYHPHVCNCLNILPFLLTPLLFCITISYHIH